MLKPLRTDRRRTLLRMFAVCPGGRAALLLTPFGAAARGAALSVNRGARVEAHRRRTCRIGSAAEAWSSLAIRLCRMQRCSRQMRASADGGDAGIVVEAIALGESPRALVQSGRAGRIVRPGDTLEDSTVRAIDRRGRPSRKRRDRCRLRCRVDRAHRRVRALCFALLGVGIACGFDQHRRERRRFRRRDRIARGRIGHERGDRCFGKAGEDHAAPAQRDVRRCAARDRRGARSHGAARRRHRDRRKRRGDGACRPDRRVPAAARASGRDREGNHAGSSVRERASSRTSGPARSSSPATTRRSIARGISSICSTSHRATAAAFPATQSYKLRYLETRRRRHEAQGARSGRAAWRTRSRMPSWRPVRSEPRPIRKR